MEINSVFAGLNSNVSLYDTQSIFKYILFLTAIDSISGYCSFKLVNSAQLFRLFRCGWKKWYCEIMRKSTGISVAGISIVYLLSYMIAPEKEKWLAFSVFLLHIIFLSSVQAAAVMLCNQAAAVYAIIVLIQLSSIFFSQYFEGGWSILFPGNWGSINRSDFIVQNGFSLTIVIWIELLGTVFLHLFGWRMVKVFSRSVIHGTVDKT